MARTRLYIYLLTISLVLSLCSSAIALEKSSKKNCAICHVMWIDDFRADKETLIEWQPGNVLMKDTQGVVSSEEMCYSCHDGYVIDSRSVAWRYKEHRTFVKPSNKVTIPADLPLSNKDEIYCGTCHSAHGGGANTDASISKGFSFLRADNIDSQMCGMCHTRQAAFKRYYGHPVKTKSYDIPETLFAVGSKRSKSGDKVICQTCHVVHGAKGDKLTVIDNQGSALCTVCHEKQRSLIQTKHDLRVSLPDEKNIREQKPSESGPCGVCHLPHNGSAAKMWAKLPDPDTPASQQCLACHGEDSGLKVKHIGRHSHLIDVALSSNEVAASSLPLFLGDGSKNPAGRIQCFTCHDAHRWDPDNLLNLGGEKVEGDGSNSFLRISNSASSILCLVCHQDKKQLLASDHNLEVTAPDEKNLQDATVSVSGPCGACHIPHNAADEKMWAKRLSGDRDFVTQLCTSCHKKDGAAKKKLIGDYDHPVDITLEKFVTAAGLGTEKEMLPQYDSNGNQVTEGKMVCITCHEPHTWEPEKSRPAQAYTSTNMEGDSRTSFLRKANFPSSDLCKTCHSDKALVDGTDHDLSVTAPEATNLLGQTVKESGPCGACHLVHNSPNKLKLWARAYGPISEHVSIINGLCRSCHSKGNNAEAKIPMITVHPEGKLVSNITQLIREGAILAPIYTKDGKEAQIGYISCPTCHNAHQWSAFKREKGTYKNLEGNAKTSFLRNVSIHIFCKDCHALDGLYRYKFFHDLTKRGGFTRLTAPTP